METVISIVLGDESKILYVLSIVEQLSTVLHPQGSGSAAHLQLGSRWSPSSLDSEGKACGLTLPPKHRSPCRRGTILRPSVPLKSVNPATPNYDHAMLTLIFGIFQDLQIGWGYSVGLRRGACA